MTDRPILFSAPMVRAILDGRKTQTRRVLKPQPQPGQSVRPYPTAMVDWQIYGSDGLPIRSYTSPYRLGDLLWVRETWRCNGWATDLATILYRASEGSGYTAMTEQYPVAGHPPMRVTGSWRPSIHMPRWASRITLRVTDVRVQRLQDITLRDVWAEGVEVRQFALFGSDKEGRDKIGRFHFWPVWDSINAKRPGCAWDDNPWVAAITFKRVNGGTNG